MARVYLVNSPSHQPGKVLNKLGRWIPGEQLGLCYLAAVLREAGHTVELDDAFMRGWSPAEMSAKILARADDFDIVGLSVSDGKQHGAVETLALLGDLDRRVHLTMGGHTATLCAKEFLDRFPRLNSVIRGEGEIPVVELANRLDAGKGWRDTPGITHRGVEGPVSNRMPTLPHQLDHLPFPARDNLQLCEEKGFCVSVETSRGCKGVCTFCATRMMYQPSIGRTWRPRSVDHVLREVAQIIETHGVRRISFEDEDFLGFGSQAGFDRAWQMADEIERRGLDFEFSILTRVDNVRKDLLARLQQVGLRFVFIGAESGSQRSLDFYMKETSVDQNQLAVQVLQELGLDFEVLWIMYDPATQLEDVAANIAFLAHLNSLNVNLVNKLRVYHGTPMHGKLARQGRLTGDFVEYSYEFTDPRVTVFAEYANLGLSAFYEVLCHNDVLKWQIGDSSPMKQVLVLIDQRLHMHANVWLQALLEAVQGDQPLDGLVDDAIDRAKECAQYLKRVVTAWPMDTRPQLQEGAP